MPKITLLFVFDFVDRSLLLYAVYRLIKLINIGLQILHEIIKFVFLYFYVIL